jgi:hypothetical protein
MRALRIDRLAAGTAVLAATTFACAVSAGSSYAARSTPESARFAAFGALPLSVAPVPITVRHSYKNDVSRSLRRVPPAPFEPNAEEEEANENPYVPTDHVDRADGARQTTPFQANMPSPASSFDGIGYPGVGCNCAPPDTNGDVGATQYVQSVNIGIQVFNKTTGASMLGPIGIATLWNGFGGVCEANGKGDPVVLYDQLASRWVISQFAGASTITDECIAVSTTSDATGSYNRYGFHLGSSFFDYPKLGVWADAYYMSMNVFSASGSSYLGPQPFAFDRAAMLAGTAATFITPGITGGSGEAPYLPADLDGSTPPPAGAPNPFVEWPGNGAYKVYRFHVDWTTPANSTFTFAGGPAASGFTRLCSTTSSCVPQLGTSSRLDGLADRLMFRAAYRNFGSRESLVSNYTVNSGGIAGVRWLELRNLTSGAPVLFQESTYRPDSTWRWMGSAAMDASGDLAVGFSASSSGINPQLRYAGRLAGDPVNALAQGEATLHVGTGSQRNTSNRWGDYSALSVDPVDDCTFWYTSEYYSTTSSFNWRTRIGKFKFPSCASVPQGALQGAVTSSTTGAGLAGALVAVSNGVSVTSGASGAYSTTLPPGTYTLTVSKAGYSTKTVGAVAITNGGSLTVNVQLDPLPRSLNVSTSGTGSGTVTSSPGGIACGGTCSATFLGGTAVTLTATPSSSSIFDGWSGDCSGTADCILTADQDHAVTAAFNTPPLTLSVTTAGDGSGTISSSPTGIDCSSTCSHGFVTGAQVTLTATASPGASFTGWSGDCSGTGTCTVTMGDDAAVTATFERDRGMTVSKGGNGSGIVTSSPAGIACGSTCNHDFAHGTPVTLAATPAVGSVFSGWSGECSGTGACDVSMTATRSTTASFTLIPETLTLATAGSGAGSISSNPAGVDCAPACSHSFDYGTAVTLTATPAVGSSFSGWSGACSGTDTCTVSMSGARSATATFNLIPEGLTLGKSGNGTGSISSSPAGIECGGSCSHSFDYGTAVTLTATPAVGSSFSGWSGDCAGAGTCALTMSAGRSATATFKLIPETLTLGTSGGGVGVISSSPGGVDCGGSCSHDFDYGTAVTLAPNAAKGSSFLGWSGDCWGTESCTLTMTAGRSVTARFELDKGLTVTTSGDGTGSISSSPAGIACGIACTHFYRHGLSVTLTPNAGSRSTFFGWSGACSGTGACRLTMSKARSVGATFLLPCVVPDVRGKTIAPAGAALGRAHCLPGKVTRVHSRKPFGKVIAQRPAPGAVLQRPGFVDLVLSSGKK